MCLSPGSPYPRKSVCGRCLGPDTFGKRFTQCHLGKVLIGTLLQIVLHVLCRALHSDVLPPPFTLSES